MSSDFSDNKKITAIEVFGAIVVVLFVLYFKTGFVFSIKFTLFGWVLIALAVISFFVVLFFLQRLLFKKKKTHGSAAWMSKWQQRELIHKDNKGLVVDGIRRLGLKESYTNMLIVAPTGGGKSTSYVIPNIIDLKDYSMIVIDPSGELYDQTASSKQKMGFDIKVLEPGNPNSNQFNFLNHINSLKECRMVAASLMSRLGESDFWAYAAEDLLCSVFYYVCLVWSSYCFC